MLPAPPASFGLARCLCNALILNEKRESFARLLMMKRTVLDIAKPEAIAFDLSSVMLCFVMENGALGPISRSVNDASFKPLTPSQTPNLS